MLARDNRIGDMQVVMILAQSNAFFASTSLLIIGGCLAILGRARPGDDRAAARFRASPATPPFVWEMKVLLLVVVFVFAFFKLTWSLRQFNYVAILIGAAPPPEQAGTRRRPALRATARPGSPAGPPSISTRRCAPSISAWPR